MNKNTREQQLQAFGRLLDVLDELREKCPWDKKQTNESLRPNTIEETYELCDALMKGDAKEICKELGDVLLHVCFYAKIGSETGAFDIADVCNRLCDKLIFRHPHVYPPASTAGTEGLKAETAGQVIEQWEQLKQKEKDGNKTVLSGVPEALPSLIKAYRIQDKARAVGFDWEEHRQVWGKVKEEIAEFEAEVENMDKEKATSEFGDVLFSLINAARLYKINPDNALERTNRKFINRFTYLESRTLKEGRDLKAMSLEEMDRIWDEAKRLEQLNKAEQSEARAYVCYHTPGSPDYHRLISYETPETFERIADLPLTGGYVIMPFAVTKESPLVFIRPDKVDSPPLPEALSEETALRPETDEALRRRDYEPSFLASHRRVKSGRLKKVVLSRRLRVRRLRSVDAFALFVRACRMRPNGFTALWHTPQTGTWLVATPEPLVERTDNRWHTVALAGTLPVRKGAAACWDDKNREEQAVVARFITEKLSPLTGSLTVAPTRTLEAGNVCHLCTDFAFDLPSGGDIRRVIEALHPTPAVCGLPRSEALAAILEDETSPRRYYAGFSGPLGLGGETRLYVSLRCMQLAQEEAVLYAGGGIMPDSRMETEWEETERKLQTMLNLLSCTVTPRRSTN